MAKETTHKMPNRSIRVPTQLNAILAELLKVQGIKFNEYVRNLIIADLDRRNIFTTKVNVELFGVHGDKDVAGSPIEADSSKV